MRLRLVFLICFAPLLFAQGDDVRKLLKDSEDAWNRADLVAFAGFYEDSPQTTFIGREVTQGGPKEIVARYRRGYPTPEKMGQLTFSEIEVRPLGDGYALAHGRSALKRS